MKHTFTVSNCRMGVIEYYEQTAFPNNEEYMYRKSEDEKEKEKLLQTQCPIKPRIDKIYFICVDKKELEQSGFSETVYYIDGQDVFNLKTALADIDKLYEAKTHTLAQHYELMD